MINGLPLPNQQLIGHRGIAGLMPENTFLGFRLASKLGLNWVEFDTQRCQTGEWVVIHDDTLERTTNGFGQVLKTPYEALKSLEAGLWFSPPFQNTRIPLLADTLQEFLHLQLNPNIEIKSSSKKEDIIEKEALSLLTLLKAVWPAQKPLPLVSSFNLNILICLKTAWKELPLGYNIHDFTYEAVKITEQYGFSSLHCDHVSLDLTHHHKNIGKITPLPLLAYTVNDQNRIQALLNAGITAVFSDMTFLKAD